MLKVTMEIRRYHTGKKRVDVIIIAWMVTLLMPGDLNMLMNLMGAGITAAPLFLQG